MLFVEPGVVCYEPFTEEYTILVQSVQCSVITYVFATSVKVFTSCHDAVYRPEVLVVPASVVCLTKYWPVPTKVGLNVDVWENHVHVRIRSLL